MSMVISGLMLAMFRMRKCKNKRKTTWKIGPRMIRIIEVYASFSRRACIRGHSKASWWRIIIKLLNFLEPEVIIILDLYYTILDICNCTLNLREKAVKLKCWNQYSNRRTDL